MGFELASYNDMLTKFNTEFKYSTDTFGNVYNSYVKLNPTDDQSIQLGDEKNQGLKEYTDLHRYFIFKKVPEQPDDLYFNSTSCRKNLQKLTNQRYPDVKLPFLISLDMNQINQQITVPRKLLGNTDNIVDVSVQFNALEEKLLKLDSNLYLNDSNSFQNTMKYISEYTKSAIYVRIINGSLVSFVPMMSLEMSKAFKIKKKLSDSELEEGEIPEEEVFQVLVFKPHDTEATTQIKTYLDAKGSSPQNILSGYEEPIFNSSSSLNSNTDYCYVSLGKASIQRLIPQYFGYMSLFSKLVEERGQQLSDCELVINVLEHPIVKKTDGPYINNPIKNSDFTIEIPSNLYPILSSKENDKYDDILNIDYYSFALANKLVLPVTENYCIDFPNKIEDGFTLEEKKKYALLFNYNGCTMNDESINLRQHLLNQLIEANESMIDYYYINNIGMEYLPNLIHNDKIYYQLLSTKQLELVNKRRAINIDIHQSGNMGYMYPELNEYSAVVYISGYGSDEILTNLIHANKTIIYFQDKTNKFTYWYENMFIPYRLDEPRDSENNINANIIIVESDNNTLIDSWNNIKSRLTDDILSHISINMTALSKIIFNSNNILDYYVTLINKLSSKVGNEYIDTNIKRGILNEQSNNYNKMYVNRDYVPFIIGKGGKRINYIKKISNANIQVGNIDNSITEHGILKIPIEIYGSNSDIRIAESMINKYTKIKVKYVDILNNMMNRLIGVKGRVIKQIQSKHDVKIYTRNIRPEELTDDVFETLSITKEEYKSNNVYTIIKILSFNEGDIDSAIAEINSLVGRTVRSEKVTATLAGVDFGEQLVPDSGFDLFGDSGDLFDKPGDDTYYPNLFDYGADQELEYVPKSPSYGFDSPGGVDYTRQPQSPAYAPPGRDGDERPTTPASSQEYVPESPKESPWNHLDDPVEYVFVVPKHNKNEHFGGGTISDPNDSDFNKKFNSYIEELNSIIKYDPIDNSDGIYGDYYKVIVLDRHDLRIDDSVAELLSPECVEFKNGQFFAKRNSYETINMISSIISEDKYKKLIYIEPFVKFDIKDIKTFDFNSVGLPNNITDNQPLLMLATNVDNIKLLNKVNSTVLYNDYLSTRNLIPTSLTSSKIINIKSYNRTPYRNFLEANPKVKEIPVNIFDINKNHTNMVNKFLQLWELNI